MAKQDVASFPADKLSERKLPGIEIFSINWMNNYEAALQKASKSSGIVMAYFGGTDWCSYCKELDREVFKNKDFRKWLSARKIVPLLVDFPTKPLAPDVTKQNNDLKLSYKVAGYPTVIAIRALASVCTDPNKPCQVKATEIGRLDGYTAGTADRWTRSFASFTGFPYP